LKIRNSATLKQFEPVDDNVNNGYDLDIDKFKNINMSLGPVMTKKKPIPGGMVTPDMMKELHDKAKKQIGFKKKTNYI